MNRGAHDDVSKQRSIRVLLLEDDPTDAELSLRQLRHDYFRVDADVIRTPGEFKERISSGAYDIVLGGYRLPGGTGLEAVRWLRARGYSLPFILVSGTLGDDVAVECIKLGVTDYVIKGRLERLSVAVRRALEEKDLRRERDRAEQELKESEKQYRLLFEMNPNPMWVFDSQSLAILKVNEAAVVHYGYSRREFLSMTILDICPAETISAVHHSVNSRSPGRLEAERWRHRKKDGTVVDVELTSHDLSFYGKPAILAQAHDISERLRNEEGLRQSAEMFSKTFRRSPLPITISTRDDARFIVANEAFLRMVGRSWEEVVGHTAMELHIWSSSEDRAMVIDALDHDGRVSSLEALLNSTANGVRSVQISAEPIQLNGIPCVLAVTNDVTESRRMEEQFQQAQKMEAVGRVAGGIAHDFNNMLGVIIGYCELAKSRTTLEAATKDVQQVKKAAQRSSELTRQLLAFSRQQVLRPSILNLNDVVKNISPMLVPMLGKDISFTFIPAVSLGKVKADLGQMEQVLANLVLNARDAIASEGKLFIETANVELDENYSTAHRAVLPGPYVLLSVSDTGCGMDSKTTSRIFEPFFTTKTSGEGTGLGLAMAYGVIQQSGGHITVYSEPGHGTTFKIYLPRIEDAAKPLLIATPDKTLPRCSETVLLVEDQLDLCELTTKLLESEGYRVLEAHSGPVALSISEEYQRPIDILLTDVVLPEMSATVLAAQVKKARPTLKVLYMSGYTEEVIAHRGVLSADNGFIQKPFTKQSLLSELRGLLDHQ